MGQRVARRSQTPGLSASRASRSMSRSQTDRDARHSEMPGVEATNRWAIGETPLGWIAVQQNIHGVLRVRMGFPHQRDLIAALPDQALWSSEPDSLVARLREYLAGARDDFLDVPIAATWSTPFQRDVVAALRRVPYGQATSYGELAARVGRPQAARAVGHVMATNPVPFLVPCHRVLGAGGALGGFSAPTGVALKRKLLELESAVPGSPGIAIPGSSAGAARR
jgi:methylated-DNA-[protein]-cysteine S-methyltransferase